MSEDIKEIEKTLPKLRDFHTSYSGLASDADALLSKIDEYSVSAISSEAVKAKSKGLQVCADTTLSCRLLICHPLNIFFPFTFCNVGFVR